MARRANSNAGTDGRKSAPTHRLLRKGDYIHGSFIKPELVDGFLNTVNPGNRSDVLGRFPFSEASATSAVEMAIQGARAWHRFPLNKRANLARVFRDHVARFQERLAQLITRETGKPLWESRQEVLATIRALDLFLDDGMNLLSPQVLDEIGARSDHIGRGVVAVLAPFNFPMLVAATQCTAALLAGNAVVLKPSKFTPGVGQFIAEIWDRCKLPRGVFHMVQGPGSVVGQRLLAQPGLDAVLFTGRYNTARTIRAQLEHRPMLPVMMQCGGKGTAIVLDGAEVDRSVYEVVVGAFLTAGQRHNSTARVIVTDAVASEFTSELMRRMSRLNVGYGFDSDTFMGPLVCENLRTRYRRYCRRLSTKGHHALIEAGAERTSYRGYYARPALYGMDWRNADPVLNTEPPGPVLMLYRVKDWEEAAALHNQCSFRLATSVFCKPNDPVLPELRARLRTGALNINRGTIGASMRLPATGLGHSSNGLPGGLGVLRFLTHARAELVEQRPFDAMPSLPGTNWNAPEEAEETEIASGVELTGDITADLATESVEEHPDLTSSLELALE